MAETEHLDTESMPLTERYTPTFDTGVHPKVEPESIEPAPPAPRRHWWHRHSDVPEVDEPDEVPDIDDVAVADRFHCVRWWQLMLVLLAVWVPAGAAGAGLFYWWSHDASQHKTTVVFAVLVFIVVSTVVGLILAMVPDKPLVSAVSIAMMSAVFAAVVGAAPVYGKFYCDHSHHRCLSGVLPY